jgi:hypothetical protein
MLAVVVQSVEQALGPAYRGAGRARCGQAR